MRSQTVRNTLILLALAGCVLPSVTAREVSLEDRVRAQAAIERVYYSHQIGVTRPFEKAVPRAVLERQVRTYLQQTVDLERFRGLTITTGMLSAEATRMSRETRMPERLRELFAALGNDPVLIEECLAKPALVSRLSGAWATEITRTSSMATQDSGISGFIPEGRSGHTAVWTGSFMIVWGGDRSPGFLNTGGRYDPATDTWTPTSAIGAPAARDSHTAVWTGDVMIIWGGYALGVGGYTATGGSYNPLTDTWTSTSTINAPAGRVWHTSIWTGQEMVVWGGFDGVKSFGDGGRYDSVTDTWHPISTAGGPSPRYLHSSVWTGNEMIVWGGFYNPNTGGRYDPMTDSWKPTSTINAPQGRHSHTALWTGSVMVVWGGIGLTPAGSTLFFDTGGRYDPATDTWGPTSTDGVPAARVAHTVVWTGDQMVIWGGSGAISRVLDTGGRYDPLADTWKQVKKSGAPAARYGHTAVWTGNEMIVWGGFDGMSTFFNTGARYSAERNVWHAMSTSSTILPMVSQESTEATAVLGRGAQPGLFMSRGGRPTQCFDRSRCS